MSSTRTLRVLFVTMAALVTPGSAGATSVEIGPTGLVVTAHPGEDNLLGITSGAEYLVTEGSGRLVAGPGCTRLTRLSASCPYVPGLAITTLDGKDVVHVDVPTTTAQHVAIALGSGPDELMVAGVPCPASVYLIFDLGTWGRCGLNADVVVTGDDGADILRVGGQPRRVDGGAGDDIIGLPDSTTRSLVFGGSGNDTIDAAGTVDGGAGNDVMRWVSNDSHVSTYPPISIDGPPDIPGPPQPPTLSWYGGPGDDDITRGFVNLDCGDGTDVVHDKQDYAWACEQHARL